MEKTTKFKSNEITGFYTGINDLLMDLSTEYVDNRENFYAIKEFLPMPIH